MGTQPVYLDVYESDCEMMLKNAAISYEKSLAL
jgi:hypothetical protein